MKYGLLGSKSPIDLTLILKIKSKIVEKDETVLEINFGVKWGKTLINKREGSDKNKKVQTAINAAKNLINAINLSSFQLDFHQELLRIYQMILL